MSEGRCEGMEKAFSFVQRYNIVHVMLYTNCISVMYMSAELYLHVFPVCIHCSNFKYTQVYVLFNVPLLCICMYVFVPVPGKLYM